jgi:RNA polymerase sigma-70 factor, ECF subfamily
MDSDDIVQLAQLAQRAQAGEREALEALVQACRMPVYRLAISILDDPQEAQDAAQEALIRMLRGLGTYRREASFRTWLYAITLNVCRGRLRKRQRNQRLLAALGSLVRLGGRAAELPEEQVLHGEQRDELMRAVGRLPEEQRTALVLRYDHGLTVVEIADLLGVVERTVYVWLRKAFDRLHEELEDLQD